MKATRDRSADCAGRPGHERGLSGEFEHFDSLAFGRLSNSSGTRGFDPRLAPAAGAAKLWDHCGLSSCKVFKAISMAIGAVSIASRISARVAPHHSLNCSMLEAPLAS